MVPVVSLIDIRCERTGKGPFTSRLLTTKAQSNVGQQSISDNHVQCLSAIPPLWVNDGNLTIGVLVNRFIRICWQLEGGPTSSLIVIRM